MEFNITEEELEKIVRRLANEIFVYFNQKNIDTVYFIIILTSSLVFASDLMRELSKLGLKLRTDMIRAKSYKGKESGELKIRSDDFLQKDLNNENILIVDDIYDTGETLFNIKKLVLDLYKPNMLEFCCLLNKIHQNRTQEVAVKFIGKDVPDVFIVGYGLDHDGKYREIPYITTIDQLE
jgi:hypoxanthine phosphoribosyltransferase